MTPPTIFAARPSAAPLLLLLALLLLAACGSSQNGEAAAPDSEQTRATEEALASTESSAADTAAAAWTRADTAGSATDTTSADSVAVTYRTYRNDKYGFSVRYPSGLMRPAGEVGNGNGRTFRTADGAASMLAYATGEATAEGLRRRFEEQTANPDLDVTYRTRGSGWYVLSGYRGNQIFYERVEARDSTLKVVRMLYDRTQKTRFDPIVREISFSLSG